VPVERIVVGGGGARSPLWREIQANVYGRAVETIAADEGAAYGAAILAGVGARLWASVDEAVEAVVRRGGTTPPQADVVTVLNDRYSQYRRVYRALRSVADSAAPKEAYV
jgi:xylulokinase